VAGVLKAVALRAADTRPADQDVEEGLSDEAPETSVAAAAAAADTRAGGGGGAAQLQAAPNGSIVAFIYGDGLADSGRPGEVVGSDDVAFTARWAPLSCRGITSLAAASVAGDVSRVLLWRADAARLVRSALV
jgi:hypothetical protein